MRSSPYRYLALIGLGAALAASVLHSGLSARAVPTAPEIWIARHVRHLAIPSQARAQQNPVPATAENLHDGEMHFADHCAICHGNDGGGDTMMGHGLFPKPPNLRLPQTQKLSDGELFWIIENGVRFTGMPAFGGGHDSQDSWKLVDFIRHLPQLTEEERLEMERNNPKGPDDRKEEQEEDNFLNGAPAPKEHEMEHHHP